MKRFVLILCVLAGGAWLTIRAAVPGTVSYQGQYTDNGVLVSGDYEFVFRLFDLASGGTQVWTETKTLTVTNGIFHTELGSVTALPDTLFKYGQSYWLETEVATTLLSPRILFNNYVGKAAYADTAFYAYVAESGGSANLWSTDGTNVWRSGGKVTVGGSSQEEQFTVFSDDAQILSWQRNGISDRWALGANTDGAYIRDQSNPLVAMFWGENGRVGIGTTTPTASKLDVKGSAVSGRDYLISAVNSDGNHLATAFDWDTNKWLIRSSGVVYPIVFAMGSTEALGIDTNGDLDLKMHTLHFLKGGDGFRVRRDGDFFGASREAFVFEKLDGNSANPDGGIAFVNTGNDNVVDPALTIEGDGTVTINHDLCVLGQKNAIVPTSQGMTKVYSEESSEVWFSDYGEGRLKNGRVTIQLDPLFLETVSIDDKNPIKVFVTLNDECNGVFVKRGMTSFEVVELNGGSSSASFTYRMVAKRQGMEDDRMNSVSYGGE